MDNKEVLLHDFKVIIDDVHFRSIFIPDEYVPYDFNAHVDDHYILSGDQLREGMVIIAAEKVFRENPERLYLKNYQDKYVIETRVSSVYDRAAVQERARWSIVTNLSIDDDIVHWTSLYSDGTMIPRSYNRSIKWIVIKEVEYTVFCPYCGEYHDESSDVTPPSEPDNSLTDSNQKDTLTISEEKPKYRSFPVKVSELLYGDWIRIAGSRYQVISVEPTYFGINDGFVIHVKSVENPSLIAPMMIFPGNFIFRVIRSNTI